MKIKKFCEDLSKLTIKANQRYLFPKSEKFVPFFFDEEVSGGSFDKTGHFNSFPVEILTEFFLNSGFSVFELSSIFREYDEDLGNVQVVGFAKTFIPKGEDFEEHEKFGYILPKTSKLYKKIFMPLKKHPNLLFANLFKNFEKEVGGMPVCQLNKKLGLTVFLKETLFNGKSYFSLKFEISGSAADEKESWISARETLDLPPNHQEWYLETLLKVVNRSVENVFSQWLFKYYQLSKNNG